MQCKCTRLSLCTRLLNSTGMSALTESRQYDFMPRSTSQLTQKYSNVLQASVKTLLLDF